MRFNYFGEPIIETVEDFESCEGIIEVEADVYARISPTDDDDPGSQFHAELLDNETGETVAYTKGFATVEEVKNFLLDCRWDLDIEVDTE